MQQNLHHDIGDLVIVGEDKTKIGIIVAKKSENTFDKGYLLVAFFVYGLDITFPIKSWVLNKYV